MASDNANEQKEKAVQTYAALGIGLVCLVVGLPLWWKTTEVYRVQLPYGEIAELASSEVWYVVDFTIIVCDDTLDRSQLALFGKTLRESFEALDSGSNLHVEYKGKIRHLFEEETQAYETSRSLEEFDKALDKSHILHEHGKYTIVVLPGNTQWLKGQHTLVGGRRTTYVATPTDLTVFLNLTHEIVRKVYVNEAVMFKMFETGAGARHLKPDKASMRSLRSHPGFELTFTLLNPRPDMLDVKWDITGGTQAYLGPLMMAFEDYIDITVKSQYLFYTWLGVKPRQSGNTYVLPYESLPHIINPIEGHLSSHVSTNPTLNFVVYVPSRDQHPLHIQDSNGQASPSNSFLSPRWGGILVSNVNVPENVTLPYPVQIDMKSVMEVFISQLRLLLGVQPQVNADNMDILQPGNNGVTEWELDQWLRGRTLENIATATATLSSLAQLLEQIGNIVINDDIGNEVEEAVASLRKSKFYLTQAKLKDAYLVSRKAIASSEKAFFDPSLLQLLYFPEDQKFAIYIPLFLPISIPIIMSLIQAAKWIMAKDKIKVE